MVCIFFFNDTATTEIYTLSLHDALPICENHVWVRLAEQVDHHAALGFVRKHVFVRDGRPEQPRPDDLGGRLLFFISDSCELGWRNVHIAHAAIGKNGHSNVVLGLSVECERAGAESLEVVWMGSDGEDIHG